MAKNISYLDNLKKEIAERGRASDRAARASDEAKYGIQGIKQPGAQARASKTAQTRKNATGQLIVAVLMGARYDEKGRRISAQSANARKMAPKKPMPKPKAK